MNVNSSCPIVTSQPPTAFFTESISGPQALCSIPPARTSVTNALDVSVEDLLSSGAFETDAEAENAVREIRRRTENVPPTASHGSSSVRFSPQVMESDPQGTIRMRALNHAHRPGGLASRGAADARAGSLPTDPFSLTEQMIANYFQVRQILLNSYPHRWPEPQRNAWDRTPTVYSQVNPPFPSNRGIAPGIRPITPTARQNMARSSPVASNCNVAQEADLKCKITLRS